MATLMVIGGTGFFGKSILDGFHRGLLSKWFIDEVIIISRNSVIFRQCYPELVTDRVTLIDLDISVANYLPYADYIIHAASSTDAKNYLLQPNVEKKNILSATSNFSTLLTKGRGNTNTKVVYCSTGAVYGQQASDLMYLSETSPFLSLGSLPEIKRNYSAAKRDSETIIRAIGLEGYQVSIARCFAFIGPYLPRDQHFAIGNFLGNALRREPIVILSKTPVIRTYMYADDLICWLMTIAEYANSNCPIYNVGSDQPVTLVDLAEYIAEYFDLKFTPPKYEMIKVDRYVPCIQKAKSELGLAIEYDLKGAITATIKSIRGSSLG